MMLPEFLILFRDGSWHIECGNQMFGSYETLVSATVAAVKVARFNLMNLRAWSSREPTVNTRPCGIPRNQTYTSSDWQRGVALIGSHHVTIVSI